jgi:hypothetical protein
LHMHATTPASRASSNKRAVRRIFGVQPMTKSRHAFGKADRTNGCRKW